MGKAFIQEETLQAIAGAIRGKNGSSDTYTPLQMVTAIENIPTGGTSGPDYLCFVTNTPGAKLCLNGLNMGGGTMPVLDVEYSTDKENWTTLEFNEGGAGVFSDTITFTNIGDCVYFRGNNPNGTASMESGYIYYFSYPYFSDIEEDIPKTNEFSVYGSVGSLKDKTGQNVNGGMYMLLFSDYFYVAGEGKTSYQITSAPSLPSNTVVLSLYAYMFGGQDLLKQPARMYPFESLTVSNSQAFAYMYSGCDLANTAILPKLQLPDDYTEDDVAKLMYALQGTFYGKIVDGSPTISQSIVTTDNGATLKPIPLIDFPLTYSSRYYDTWLFATEILGCDGGFETANILLYCEGDIGEINDHIRCIYHERNIVSSRKCWIPTNGSSTLEFSLNNIPGGMSFVKWQVSNDGGSTWTDATTSMNYEVVLSTMDDFYIKAVFATS